MSTETQNRVQCQINKRLNTWVEYTDTAHVVWETPYYNKIMERDQGITAKKYNIPLEFENNRTQWKETNL